jgi:hypothetical protein
MFITQCIHCLQVLKWKSKSHVQAATKVMFFSRMLMCMPDALPMEIALIAPFLFKFQVYLTSFHHHYNRLITLPTLQLLYQSTIHHMALINALQLPQEVLLFTRLALHTASATWSSIAATSLDFYQFSQPYFQLNHTSQESWDPLMAILQPSSIFKFNYGTALGKIAATFITSST